MLAKNCTRIELVKCYKYLKGHYPCAKVTQITVSSKISLNKFDESSISIPGTETYDRCIFRVFEVLLGVVLTPDQLRYLMILIIVVGNPTRRHSPPVFNIRLPKMSR
jgi:hypothetical protein